MLQAPMFDGLAFDLLPFDQDGLAAPEADIGGCCQTNANRSQLAGDNEVSGHAQPTPLGKSGGAVSLKVVAAVEVAFLVEVVMDGGMNGGEFLQTSHASETQHRSFSSS